MHILNNTRIKGLFIRHINVDFSLPEYLGIHFLKHIGVWILLQINQLFKAPLVSISYLVSRTFEGEKHLMSRGKKSMYTRMCVSEQYECV